MTRERRIGITGHRWNKIHRRHRRQLETLLTRTFLDIGVRHSEPKRLVCGMAEGTDLVAAIARPDGWELEAVMPLPPADWRRHLASSSGTADAQDFDRALPGAEILVLPHGDGPDYGAVARHLAETCDIIVAVWDGLSPWPGGTGDVVARARERGAQVIVLPPPGSDQPGS